MARMETKSKVNVNGAAGTHYIEFIKKDIPSRLAMAVNRLEPDGKGGFIGTRFVGSYMEEIRRYRKYPTRVLLGQMMHKNYETSDDLKAVAWIFAYHDIINLKFANPADSSLWDYLKPHTEAGIKIWDDIMLDLVNKDNRLDPEDICKLIIDKDTRNNYQNSDNFHVQKLAHDHLNDPVEEESPEIPNDADIVFETTSDPAADEAPFEEAGAEKKEEPKISNPKIRNDIKTIIVKEETHKPDAIVEPVVDKVYPNITEREPDKKDESDVKLDVHVAEEPTIMPTLDKYFLKEEDLKTFGEAMKTAITFDDQPVSPTVDYTNPIAVIEASNNIFEAQYIPLTEFRKLLEENGLHCIYNGLDYPAGRLLLTNIYNPAIPGPMSTVIIDPNVLYRNGYNVLSTSKEGDILKECVCSINDKESVMTIVNNAMDKKFEKRLHSRLPYGTKAVLEMTDLSGLGARELSTTEWKKLILNIYSVIKTIGVDWKYRAKLAEYDNPEKFKILCDDNVLPLFPEGTGKDYSDITKTPEDEGFWIDYDSKKYGDKKYDIGMIPASQEETK